MKKNYHAGKGKSLGQRIYRARQLYLFLLLPIIYLIIFKYIPMFGLQIAFKDYSISKGMFGSPWVGFKYFNKFFHDYNFKRILVNTLRISLYSLVVNFFIPVTLALCLNCLRHTGVKKVIQTITYIPHFVSTVVLVGMMNQMLNPIIGLYGNAVQTLTGSRAADILGMPSAFPHLYVWTGVWQNMGWSSIIYIAALASCDQELHEAAQIDGATRFQRVLYVDIPSIIPTAIIMLILDCGRVMNIGFEKVYLMQNSLNLSYSEVISTYVYKLAFGGSGNFSYSTAVGMFNSVINFILIVSVNQISRKFSDTSLW